MLALVPSRYFIWMMQFGFTFNWNIFCCKNIYFFFLFLVPDVGIGMCRNFLKQSQQASYRDLDLKLIIAFWNDLQLLLISLHIDQIKWFSMCCFTLMKSSVWLINATYRTFFFFCSHQWNHKNIEKNLKRHTEPIACSRWASRNHSKMIHSWENFDEDTWVIWNIVCGTIAKSSLSTIPLMWGISKNDVNRETKELFNQQPKLIKRFSVANVSLLSVGKIKLSEIVSI